MNETPSNAPPRRLGRGLSALLGGSGPAYSESEQEMASELRQIAVNMLSPNPFQPRQQFDAESLGELASSIREHGILQPLLVREVAGCGFQLIAGERRWQAAQKAGLTSVPCRIVDVVDKTACEFALEENLKRKDLNDLEKAQAFKDYLTQFDCTIEELSKQLSMNRSTVNNMLRLLDLPAPVKNALNSGRISAGHARALLSLPEADQLELTSRIQAEQLSVRAVEAVVKKMLGREPAPAEPVVVPAENRTDVPASVEPGVSTESDGNAPVAAVADTVVESQATPDAEPIAAPAEATPETIPMSQGADPHRTHHVESLESQLRDLLGVKVEIQLQGRESGKIQIPFSSNDEFERVLNLLRRYAA